MAQLGLPAAHAPISIGARKSVIKNGVLPNKDRVANSATVT
jgi:hypothetical protein